MNQESVLQDIKKQAESDTEKKNVTVVFTTENLLTGRIGLPIEIRYQKTAKTGRVMDKKEKTYFFPMYDPFTGKKVK